MASLLSPITRRLARAWSMYSHALEKRPFITKGCTAFTIYTTADVIRQRYEFSVLDAKEQELRQGKWLDEARAVRLSSWYAVVHAPYIHMWYGFLDKLYGIGPGFRLAFKKVVTDQTLNMPLFLGVTLYVSARMSGMNHTDAWEKTKRDHLETIIGAALCWVPALCVNFMYVPPKYRLLFVNVVQVGFGVFLSKMANRSADDTPPSPPPPPHHPASSAHQTSPLPAHSPALSNAVAASTPPTSA
ncbi:hypothetical protein PTSG_00068 [Salpingoeca rosetta]|uniref:Uncharacterized protein n=1 Tax=Salpingoeca rosetta (strain ATCC 50818 / BSB-021) TaxID=946362 RepID=F2TVF6_SALR5|nr:uncharacterized protein PTSG_00068 [Salpingoeca rosetta]EGD72052.1 hypothetical protein PTSG_00068 [Salpingoeca rosetta]|eukprot:XP_004998624.1 hypothetical protein PTSG_00068 [Salpingoeca rosetta]